MADKSSIDYTVAVTPAKAGIHREKSTERSALGDKDTGQAQQPTHQSPNSPCAIRI